MNPRPLFSNCFRKLCRLWDNVEKYGSARQATDDYIILRLPFACWVTKSTDTNSEYHHHHHHHHHHELWRFRRSACFLTLKVKLVLPMEIISIYS